LLAAPGQAQTILGAAYDAANDAIVIDVVYRGTNPHHRFSVQWGPCRGERPGHVTGRLVHDQWKDRAERDFRVRRHISIAELPCRPAVVTLRLGKVAHETVHVP
jgi:hypothetical protein